MTDERYRSVFAPGLLENQVCLITGGGTGIGRAIAHEVASLGGTVVIMGRRPEPLVTTIGEIRAAGGLADHRTVDVRDADAVERVVADVVADHGRIDHLINNAGGQFPSPAEAITPNGWRSVVDLNLTGTFLMTRAVFNASMDATGGSVCTIIADVWNGFPLMAHSGAARAGVENLTRSLAVEWGSRGVRVNAVAPGLIYSSGVDTYAPDVQRTMAANVSKVPAGRVGTESETSAAVVFLMSPAAAYITGATIRVDGGSSLARAPMVELEGHDALPPFDGFHLSRSLPEGWGS